MSLKKNIALFYGGNSEEAEVSVKSGKNVAACINKEKYEVYEILLRGDSWKVLNPDGKEIDIKVPISLLKENDEKVGVEIDKTKFSFTYNAKEIKFDLAYIVIHGTPGENGLLQGYFEMLGIPYNTCSSFVSAITFDKHSCKRFLDFSGVKMAKDVFLRRGDKYSTKEIVNKLGLPVFVKPTNGGSSFGVTKVKREEDLKAAIDFVFKEYDSAIIEEALNGRELTNGIYFNGKEIVKLPVTEIITEREFFDYEAKYLGESKEVCPAEISLDLTKNIQQTSEKLYKYLGCSGLVRMDYIVCENDIYFLEINTVPGMTAMSLVPAQVKVAGIKLEDFFETLVNTVK